MDLMKIIVLEACGLHLGYLGCYGNDWVATPNLDRLAAEGIVFEWHIADHPELHANTPWNQRSVGTGRYAPPGQTPIVSNLPLQPHIVPCEALPLFADQAIQAANANDAWLWIEGPSLLPPWVLEDDLLDAYFDEDDVEEGLTPWRDPPLGPRKLNDAEVVQLQNTYAAAVTFFDAQLGKLLDHLGDDTLLCVTARSGLPLGEHGMIGIPEPQLHDELVRVPLIMRMPKTDNAGLRIAALTQPIDLAPTFLEALGQPMPKLDWHSLWPLMRGEVEQVRSFAISMLQIGDQESWLMRTLDRALTVPIAPTEGGPQMFIKPEDRWEVNDLYKQNAEAAEEMETELRAFVKSSTNYAH
jgi:hypothetical protein